MEEIGEALTTALEAYANNPTAEFVRIAKLAVGTDRAAVLDTLAAQFYATRKWRIAQHLVLLHLDLVPPQSRQRDVVLACLFADHAVRESEEHPMAYVVHAHVCWARRVVDGVLYDCERIEQAGTMTELPDPAKAELMALRSMAYAYSGRPAEGLVHLEDALRLGCRNSTRVEALLQMLMVSEGEPQIALWAARQVAELHLPAIAAAAVQRALRVGLLTVLRKKPQ